MKPKTKKPNTSEYLKLEMDNCTSLQSQRSINEDTIETRTNEGDISAKESIESLSKTSSISSSQKHLSVANTTSSLSIVDSNSVISSLSHDESHAGGHLRGADLLNAMHSGSWDESESEAQTPKITTAPQLRGYGMRPELQLRAISGSSASSRDSLEMFRQHTQVFRNLHSLPTPQSNNSFNRLSASCSHTIQNPRKTQNILPPLSQLSSRSLKLSRDMSLETSNSMEYFSTYASPSSFASDMNQNLIYKDNQLSLPNSSSRFHSHRRNISNTSSNFSNSETSALFPMVGYISDENSRVIQRQESTEKKSWAAREIKYFSKKFTSKRRIKNMNKGVELQRANGYLM